jgi:recombination endonuclease VII
MQTKTSSRRIYERNWKRNKRRDPAFRLRASAIQRKYYLNDPNKKEKALVYRLKSRYGITPVQYKELFDRQEGKCSICKKHQSELKHRLVLDHDHKSHEIRSLLCTYCNLWIVGKLRKDTIQPIYDYLMGEYTGWFVPIKKKKRKRRGRSISKSRQ